MKKKLFLVLFIGLTLFVYGNFIHRTKGFSLQKIISKHSYNPKWDMGPLTSEQKALLDRISKQTFHYLGSGKECYAFVSEDEEIVIKFFKQKHMKTQSFIKLLPMNSYLKALRQETFNKRHYLREKTFSSYTIAYRQFPERTGLLFLHLNPSNTLKRTLKIISPKGRRHTLDLDKIEFLLQKRADNIFDRIAALMKDKKVSEAQAAISSLLDLIITRNQKGIFDQDNNCKKNLGLIGESAMQIDIGEFRMIPSRYPSKKELSLATEDLDQWLITHHPSLALYLKQEIQKRL